MAPNSSILLIIALLLMQPMVSAQYQPTVIEGVDVVYEKIIFFLDLKTF